MAGIYHKIIYSAEILFAVIYKSDVLFRLLFLVVFACLFSGNFTILPNSSKESEL
jgi:hypothetical protein